MASIMLVRKNPRSSRQILVTGGSLEICVGNRPTYRPKGMGSCKRAVLVHARVKTTIDSYIASQIREIVISTSISDDDVW